MSARPRSCARSGRARRRIGLIQLREKDWPLAHQRVLARRCSRSRARMAPGCCSMASEANARAWGCAGVHWTAATLAAAAARPRDLLCSASCHTPRRDCEAGGLASISPSRSCRPTPTHRARSRSAGTASPRRCRGVAAGVRARRAVALGSRHRDRPRRVWGRAAPRRVGIAAPDRLRRNRHRLSGSPAAVG